MAKRKDDTEKVTIVMHKGNMDETANMLKTHAMSVLIRFVARVRDAEMMEDDNTVILTISMNGDDPEWVQNNILKYVDILGAATDAQIDAKVDRLMARYNEQADASPEKVGAGIVIRYLNNYYLIQRSASVFRRGDRE